MLRTIAVILLIALVLPILPIGAVTTVTADSTPSSTQLSWSDSGYDLAAGFRYSIGLDSGCTWLGACALASFSAGPIRAELQGSRLKIMINNNVAFEENVGEHVTLNIIVDCDGSGQVEVSGYRTVGGFSIDRSYRILVYTESQSTWPQTVTSRVTISRQSIGCRNPSITPISENPSLEVNPLWASIAGALGTAGTIVIIILVLVGLFFLIMWLLPYGKRAYDRARAGLGGGGGSGTAG